MVWDATFRVLRPLYRELLSLRVRPGWLSAFSLAWAVFSGVAVAQGTFGLAAGTGLISLVLDLLVAARRAGPRPRWQWTREFLWIAGAVIHYRGVAVLCAVALVALFSVFVLRFTVSAGCPAESRNPLGNAVFLLPGIALTPWLPAPWLDIPIVRGALPLAFPLAAALLLTSVFSYREALDRFYLSARANPVQ